jgi:hypothetical protein
MRLPADRRTLLTRLGMIVVSDEAFIVALAIAPVLQLETINRFVPNMLSRARACRRWHSGGQ